MSTFVENPILQLSLRSCREDEYEGGHEANDIEGAKRTPPKIRFNLESFSRYLLAQFLTPLFPTYSEVRNVCSLEGGILKMLYLQALKHWKAIFLCIYLPLLLSFIFSPFAETNCEHVSGFHFSYPAVYLLCILILFYFFPILLIVLSPFLYPFLKLLNNYFSLRNKSEKEKIHSLIECFLASSEHNSSRKAKRIIACVYVVFSLVLFFSLDFPTFVYGWVILFLGKDCPEVAAVKAFFIFTLFLQTLFTIIPCVYLIYHYVSELYQKAFDRKDFNSVATDVHHKILSNRWEELHQILTSQISLMPLPGRHIALSLALSQPSVPYEIIQRILSLSPECIHFLVQYSWYIDISILETALQANVSSQIIELLLSHQAPLLPPHIFWAIQMKCDSSTIGVLMDRCPNVFYVTDRKNKSILHALLEDASYDLQSAYVIKELCQTNQVDEEGHIPLHCALQRCASLELIRNLLFYFPEGIEAFNNDKLTPFHLLFLCNEESELSISYLLDLMDLFRELNLLSYTWLWMIEGGNESISLNFQKEFTEKLLDANSTQLQDYVYATDATGRQAIKLAASEVAAVMERFLLFCGRFEINSKYLPLHRSETSVIYFAQDFGSNEKAMNEIVQENLDNREETDHLLEINGNQLVSPPTSLINLGNARPVILKFMRNRDQYLRELSIREELMKQGHSSSAGTYTAIPFIESIISYQKGLHKEFAKDLIRFGTAFDDLHYCLVMPAAERSLKTIIDSEDIAGKDQETIFEIAKQIANALEFLHARGVIHADLKPLNIMRTATMRYKLIDFDASVKFEPPEACDYCGSKWSSAYLPPEMLWKDEINDKVKVKEWKGDDLSTLLYQPIKASPSYDLWSYGCILYQLFTNEVLWKANGNDNLNDEELEKLFSWETDEPHQLQTSERKEGNRREGIKKKVLSAITNPRQYYLLNHLLSPVSKGFRSSINYILHHSYFHPTKTSIRMPGEEFQYHAFISYRVSSDGDRANTLYHYLTSHGLKIWFDQKNILAGEDWKESFCLGLIQSKVFIPIISRNALKAPFEKLTEASPCDNVLLEYRLALELKKRGYLELICPIFIGDQTTTTTNELLFSDYFVSQCDPSCPSIIVSSVEKSLHEILNRYSFGLSFLSNMTVAAIWNELKKVQGFKIVGQGSFPKLLSEKINLDFIQRIQQS